MKKPAPLAFRLPHFAASAARVKCVFGKCDVPATFGALLKIGRYIEPLTACEVHFPKFYESVSEDGDYFPPWSMECQPPYSVTPLTLESVRRTPCEPLILKCLRVKADLP